MRLNPRHVTALIALNSLMLAFVNCSNQGFTSVSQSQFSSNTVGSSNSANTNNDSSGSSSNPISNTNPGNQSTSTKTQKVLLGVGHMGRTILSCDDGKTWIRDRSDNDLARCWVTGDPNYVECDHSASAGRGADAGDGWFFANFGWGANGSLRRSQDGVTWEVIKDGAYGAGVAFLNKALVLLWGTGFLSQDYGKTWSTITTGMLNQFGHAHIEKLKDKIFVMGDATGIAISYDNGGSWYLPANFLPAWAGSVAEGNGMIITVGYAYNPQGANTGYVAKSVDNGKTWAAKQLWSANGQTSESIFFNGKQFVTWSAGQTWLSADGENWQSTPALIDGKVAPPYWTGSTIFNPDTGTYSRIADIWGNYYEKQKAYRSSDGINWTELDSAHFKGGHPIRGLSIGDFNESICK